jgi:hypothetical protein
MLWFLPYGRHFVNVRVPSATEGAGRLYTGTLDDAADKQNCTPLLLSGKKTAQPPYL